MKKAANILLKVAKILGIIAIVALAVAAVITLVSGLIAGGALIAEGTEESIAAGAAAIGLAVAYCIGLLVYMVCQIIALVLVGKARNGLASAKCKADAKKPGIMAIVAGALGTGLAIVAGIFMLIMNDGYYQDTVVAEEKVSE